MTQYKKCSIHPSLGKWIKLQNGLWKLKCKECYAMIMSKSKYHVEMEIEPTLRNTNKKEIGKSFLTDLTNNFPDVAIDNYKTVKGKIDTIVYFTNRNGTISDLYRVFDHVLRFNNDNFNCKYLVINHEDFRMCKSCHGTGKQRCDIK